jgi:ATP-binding cassette, subfamily B, bacterial
MWAITSMTRPFRRLAAPGKRQPSAKQRIRRIFGPMRDLSESLRKMLRIAFSINRFLVIGYYLTAAIGASAPIVLGLVSKYLVDSIVAARGAAAASVPFALTITLTGYYLIGIAGDVVQWSLNQTYLDYLLRYRLQDGLTLLFSKKLTDLDVAHLEDPVVRDLIDVTADTFRWRIPDFLRAFGNAFGRSVTYVAAAVSLIPLDPIVPLALSLAVLPRIYFRARQGALQWSAYNSGAPRTRELGYYSWLLASPNSLREIKIFRYQSTVLRRFSEIQEYIFQLNRRPLDRYLKTAIFSPILEGAVLLGVVLPKLSEVVSGTISLGSFMYIVSMGSALVVSAASAGSFFGEVYEHDLYVRQFLQVMALPKLIIEDPNPVILDTTEPPRIEFRHVSFCYPSGPTVLHDVSFVIESGESVALVGVNGAGKSTIIKLLCRIYDVTDGEILINDVNIKRLSLTQWYSLIGTLFQDFVQYHFTVRENILMGDTMNDDQSLVEVAARRAGAASFVERLPRGYAQPLGREFEDGHELSGGQWQKLALARAFHQAAPILLIDEPTSAIDAAAEAEIFSNLESEYSGKTLVLVSHRFSTVRNARKIIVLDGGYLVEHGSHAELMRFNGRYAKMFRLQAKGYQP